MARNNDPPPFVSIRVNSCLVLLIPLAALAQRPPMPSEAQDPKPLVSLLPQSKPCPAGTAFAGSEEMAFDGATYGHFLSPQSDDAVVSAGGCEPHASGYGGSYLLTRTAGAWRIVWYKAGILTSQCSRFPLPPGRDGLVCYGADMAQGTFSEALYTLDLAQPQPKPDFFFRTYDTTGAIASDRGPTRRSKVDRIVINRTQVSVTVSLGMQRRFRRMQTESNGMDIPVTQYQIEYVLDGLRFRPASASEYNARLFSTAP